MYECEQTGKDEYDSSKKEDEQEPEATGSIFQGLRADIEGYDHVTSSESTPYSLVVRCIGTAPLVFSL